MISTRYYYPSLLSLLQVTAKIEADLMRNRRDRKPLAAGSAEGLTALPRDHPAGFQGKSVRKKEGV